ncbi:hypothetical protein Patl1_09952 [Pistacia atlantica]|uniref:Uncharacterized protein n=1 Tax=Pistacia atlantica TaxID=434234 RepID=A0ACC1A428_9ROSI|nr:hypothetical protein Patl1_09952 [Pistacia atlantica]
MATLEDIVVSAALNILTTFIILIAFAILRIQPFNDRVYFSKWYLKGLRSSPTHSGAFKRKFVDLDFRSYLRFLNWMPDACMMPEPELIEHAGLDSAVYLRIYLNGTQDFCSYWSPCLCCFGHRSILPNSTLGEKAKQWKVTSSDIDKLSTSNIPFKSERFWAHIVLAYLFTFWTCYVLMKEYETVAAMRSLLGMFPQTRDESVNELVEHFFSVNHPDHYLTHQTGFLGLCGKRVDAIDHHISEIEKLLNEKVLAKAVQHSVSLVSSVSLVNRVGKQLMIADERERVVSDPQSIMPAAFVSFKTRWGAAVCAQTQQTRNPTIWLTEWAPDPRDVYWKNLAIPYVSLRIRRLIIGVAFFFLTFKFIKSVIQGFLPGIVLKLFLIFLQMILMIMSKYEGFVSLSSLERRSASRYYIFKLVNVFLGSVISGSAFEQLNSFIKQSANEIPETIGVAIPIKATFFMTYIMVDGWAGIALEILRLQPLIIYHLKNSFLGETETDKEEAMDPGSIGFNTAEPRIQFYFLLGLVYATVTPLLLPFIIVFFALAYVVFRHQIINVYNQEYESGAAFWPDVHKRVIAALVISQLLLMGLLSMKEAAQSTPFLIALPVLTIWFHRFCTGLFESAFVKYPLQEAMMKDALQRAREPNLNVKDYLRRAYIHPVFKTGGTEEDEIDMLFGSGENETVLIPTKRQSRRNTPVPSRSEISDASSQSPSLPDTVRDSSEP